MRHEGLAVPFEVNKHLFQLCRTKLYHCSMKRIQLFEFEDFSALPQFIRKGITGLLEVFHNMMGSAEMVGIELEKLRQLHAFNQIVDLGSGSGGIMPSVVHRLNANQLELPVSLLLSDKFPNPNVVERFNKAGQANVKYASQSVNATELSKAPEGLKTMIACFHHMHPDSARTILRSAAENKQPLFIYEVASNTIPLLLWWLLLPLSLLILAAMALVMTPFVKGIGPLQLIFTYLIPIIPLVYAWDGQASLVRTYTKKDLEPFLHALENLGMQWEWKELKNAKGRAAGYALILLPTNQ